MGGEGAKPVPAQGSLFTDSQKLFKMGERGGFRLTYDARRTMQRDLDNGRVGIG
jgi:hypothetical protein